MLEKTTLERLRTFRVPGFIDSLMQQSGSSGALGLSFEERLTILVDSEYTRRESQRLKNRLKSAKISVAACVESVDFSASRGLNKRQYLELSSGNWLLHGINLVVTGQTGIGKTFLVSALAHALCIKGFSVRAERTHYWLAELEILASKNRLRQTVATLRKVPLIIFDEWMRDPIPDSDARLLLDLFDDRYGKLSCAFISQIPVSEWHNRFSDPTIADAVLDRIVHNSLRVELAGESLRKQLHPERIKERTSVASLRNT